MKRIVYMLLTLIVFLIGVTFALENSQTVAIGYYFGPRWKGPLSFALLATFALGAIVGYLVSLGIVVRMQRQLVQARKEIRQIEQEVINLRALPIKDVL